MTKLKSLRKFRGLTQAEVSKKTGVSLYKVSLADRGHNLLDVKQAASIERFFGRPIRKLLAVENPISKLKRP